MHLGKRVACARRAICLAAPVLAACALQAVAAPSGGLSFDAGVHSRIRQTCVRNAPGLPNGGGAVPVSSKRKANTQGIRVDSYPWMDAKWREYIFRLGLGHSFIEYLEGVKAPHSERSYRLPDILYLNNLYIDGQGVLDGLLDFRIGRQNMTESRHSVLGLDRLILDGTPGDSSVSTYSDMARFRFHLERRRTLELFGLYDCARNTMSMGLSRARERSLNRLTSSDSPEMDQFGAGAIWSDYVGEGLPFKAYAIMKGDRSYERRGERQPGKRIVTLGVNAKPQLTDTLSLDIECAQQAGRRSNGRFAGGTMGYFDVVYRRDSPWSFSASPYGHAGVWYMSGDRHRLDADDSDTAWDPLWRRVSVPSEIFANGAHPGLRYWTNMLWLNALAGLDFGRMHRVEAYSGPIFAPADDGLGGGDSSFKGVLSRINYFFPIRLAPKNARGADRIEVFGSACFELFNPGGYYASSKPAIYVRWLLNFRF